MEILQNNKNKNIILDINLDYKTDLGKEDSLELFEEETVQKIINPIENYETSRFMHESYPGITEIESDLISDIWFQLYFYNDLNPKSHIGGLDYSLVGITHNENGKMLKQSVKSFFKLEFYKTPNNDLPTHSNRKLVFSRNLSLPSGERFLYTPTNIFIYVPVFVGTSFKNRENMYIFWFQDDTVLNETILTGSTFYMTARFFNGDEGTIINFGNKSKSVDSPIIEHEDLYFLIEINKDNYTYQVFEFNGIKGNRIGMSGNPIKFYEIASG